jgi:hypothetical protein
MNQPGNRLSRKQTHKGGKIQKSNPEIDSQENKPTKL